MKTPELKKTFSSVTLNKIKTQGYILCIILGMYVLDCQVVNFLHEIILRPEM